jgi:hypothetical protein
VSHLTYIFLLLRIVKFYLYNYTSEKSRMRARFGAVGTGANKCEEMVTNTVIPLIITPDTTFFYHVTEVDKFN